MKPVFKKLLQVYLHHQTIFMTEPKKLERVSCENSFFFFAERLIFLVLSTNISLMKLLKLATDNPCEKTLKKLLAFKKSLLTFETR